MQGISFRAKGRAKGTGTLALLNEKWSQGDRYHGSCKRKKSQFNMTEIFLLEIIDHLYIITHPKMVKLGYCYLYKTYHKLAKG